MITLSRFPTVEEELLQVLVDEQEKRVAELEAELQTEATDNARLRKEYNEAQGEIDGMTADLATVTRERDEIKARIKHTEREFARLYGEQDRSRASAYQKIEELQSQAVTTVANNQRLDSECAALSDQVDSLTRELAEAKRELDAWHEAVCEATDLIEKGRPGVTPASLVKSVRKVAKELAEAREELANGWRHDIKVCSSHVRELIELMRYDGRTLGDGVVLTGETLADYAHRAKTSLPSENVTIPHGNPVVTPENPPPHETAPRRQKSKRYHIDYIGDCICAARRRFGGTDGMFNAANFSNAWRRLTGSGLDGRTVAFMLSGRKGVEAMTDGAHYRAPFPTDDGDHASVVRVEPEKAWKPSDEPCPATDCILATGHLGHHVVAIAAKPAQEQPPHGMFIHAKPRVNPFPHDGGGERSGQVGEGPPRVGDVVRVSGIEHTVTAYDPKDETMRLSGITDWLHASEVTIIRRAPQPEAKPDAPPAEMVGLKEWLDAAVPRPGDTHPSGTVVDGAPMRGPHTETVADLVRRVERVEDYMLCQQTSTMAEPAIREEIRAERAGRVKP